MLHVRPLDLLATLLALMLVFIFAGVIRRSALWRRGRRDGPVSLLWLARVPGRYFVDLHHVVARKPENARMHILVAGGTVAAMLMMIAAIVLEGSRAILGGLAVAMAVAISLGALMNLRRRRAAANLQALSQGAFSRLSHGFLALATGIFLAGLLEIVSTTGRVDTASGLYVASLGMATLLFALGCAGTFLRGGWSGPMKHAVAGTLNLAFHPRQDRFGEGAKSVALKPTQVTFDKPLGVGRIEDFSARQLLNFDACVQCGRCQEVCPAFAAGQPLNPKALIQDLVAGLEGTEPGNRYFGEGHPGSETGDTGDDASPKLLGGLLSTDTIWSCTTCRACVDSCPMMVEHVDAILDLRRNLAMERTDLPARLADTVENIRFAENAGGAEAARRCDWLTDLSVRVLEPGEEAEVLFWIGEGGFQRENQASLRATLKALLRAQVDVGILGAAEPDCGDALRRFGDEAAFLEQVDKVKASLATLRFERIVTADPHVLNSFANDYRSLGVDLPVEHHTSFLLKLVESGRLALAPRPGVITYHDPCYLGRYNGVYDAPRELLSAIGYEIIEMERSRQMSRCCGGGGGAPVTDVPGKTRIPDIRMQDVAATGTEAVAVACPNCKVMLGGVPAQSASIVDIAELLEDALTDEAGPGGSDRRLEEASRYGGR